MQHVILVVSPDTEFLQQLRSHLEEGGRYQVTVALSAHEALNLANSNFFEVAIVDGELDDIPVSAFTRDLAALQSELKILVFPPDNNSLHPVLDGLVANGFLSKPFSGQEIGKALSNIFSDQPLPDNSQVKVVDDLVKQWLQIPETGGRKAEQILESTSAQTVLIIIKDQLIASSGIIDNGLVTNVTGFLSRYWKDEENSELARFLKLAGDGSELFLYATKLVCNVVLVLIYPMNTTMQQVRRELNKVKNDFQTHYPTTGELRQDIAKQALVEINQRSKQLESLQPNTKAISQDELNLLNALQQEPSSTTEDDAISQIELDARKLFEQESLKPKVRTDSISQEEVDLLKAMHAERTKPAIAAQDNAVSQVESEARKLFEQESLKSTSPTPGVSQTELDALKLFQQESMKPSTVAVPGISEQELADLSKMLKEMPIPDPESGAVIPTPVEDKKLPEWLNELENEDELKRQPIETTALSTSSMAQVVGAGVAPFVATEDNLTKPSDLAESAAETNLVQTPDSEPLPEIDFKLPWEMEETNGETVSDLEMEQPALEQVIPEPVVENLVDSQEPTTLSFADTLGAVTPQTEDTPVNSIVETAEPGLKDFRFQYTCLLIPGDRNQFLARDLSEKLGAVMPDIHEDQGWHMTSITLRPQYLLWAAAVPIGICPHQIIHEVRNLTSNLIFTSFPEIARNKTSNDFWSSKFLAVSGSEPPPANLISDFVSQAWKTPEPAAS